MIIYVDIDGTICQTKNGLYMSSIPIQENIDKINKLFDAKHEIVYWTARGSASGFDYSHLTAEQLKKWGCRFTRIESLKKPAYDLFIDDKTFKIEDIHD